jgi:SHS2 domain-containing protein
MEGDVKAVTYNEMDITKGDTKVTVQVVLDL